MAVRLNVRRVASPGLALRAVALALVLLLVHAFIAPPDAQAFLGLPSAGDIVTKGVKTAFDFILKTLFGDIPTRVTDAAIDWQLELPSDAFTNSNVRELQQTSAAAAYGALALVMTASTLRYWLSGILEGNAGEAFSGIVRSLGAALAILAWPWFFNAAINVTNHLTFGLIHSTSVHDDVSRMLGAAVGITHFGGPISMLVSIILVVAGTVLMLVLFGLKIVLACALVVIFVGGPLVIILTPFPGTAWMARLVFRAFGTLLLWPVLWALCFAAFAAVFQDFINFKGDGGFLDKVLVKPLTAVGMLYLCVKLPLLATKASMMGIGGGGGLGFAARYVGVRQLERAVSARIGGDGSATPDHRAAADPIGPPLRGTQDAGAAASAAAGGGAAAGAGAGAGGGAASGAAAGAAAGPGGAAVGAAAGAAAGRTATGAGASASATPARHRDLQPRAAQFAERMARNRLEGHNYGLPAGAQSLGRAEVAAALDRIGPEEAGRINRVHERALASGQTPGQAQSAVSRAAAIGAARAESDDDTPRGQAYMVLGSASHQALSEGIGQYTAAAQNAADAAGTPAPGPALPTAPTPSTLASQPAPAAGGETEPDVGTPRRGPHKP